MSINIGPTKIIKKMVNLTTNMQNACFYETNKQEREEWIMILLSLTFWCYLI
jgi:hypothetical protein